MSQDELEDFVARISVPLAWQCAVALNLIFCFLLQSQALLQEFVDYIKV